MEDEIKAEILNIIASVPSDHKFALMTPGRDRIIRLAQAGVKNYMPESFSLAAADAVLKALKDPERIEDATKLWLLKHPHPEWYLEQKNKGNSEREATKTKIRNILAKKDSDISYDEWRYLLDIGYAEPAFDEHDILFYRRTAKCYQPML